MPGMLRAPSLTIRSLVLVLFVMSFLSVLAGTTAGLIWLFELSGLTRPLAQTRIHPDHQVYGFLLLFVSGVFFVLVPRFKNKDPGVMMAPAAALIGVTALDAVLALLGARPGDYLLLLSSVILLASALYLIRAPSGRFAVSDCFILLSVLSLTASVAYRVLTPGWPYSKLEFVNLVLLGFPTSMIYGVVLRTAHLRAGVGGVGWGRAWASFFSHSLGLAMDALGLIGVLEAPAPVPRALYLAAFLALASSVRGFVVVTSGGSVERMSERDRARHRYFSIVFTMSLTWMLLGLVVGLAASLVGAANHFGPRDAYIHSISVGFVGTMILAYAPILLPPLISRKVPHKGLTIYPAVVLTVGNLWRVVGFLAPQPNPLASYAWASGILVVSSMLWALVMIHTLRSR